LNEEENDTTKKIISLKALHLSFDDD